MSTAACETSSGGGEAKAGGDETVTFQATILEIQDGCYLVEVSDAHGMRLIVLEAYIYCDCEYTVLRVDKTLAENVLSTWSSDNFEIYL